MKNLLLSITLILLTTSIFAQDVQIATLQQGENLKVYYGGDALKEALDNASNGDRITLSAGTFNGTTITKAVIIQGAGYVMDRENNKFMTAISGDLTLELPEGAEGFVLEGVYEQNSIKISSKIVNTIFRKCVLSAVNLTEGSTKNCLIEQCRIGDFTPDSESQNLCVRNSVVHIINSNNNSASLLIENCIIHCVIKSSTALFRNNIIAGVHIPPYGGYKNSLSNTCSAYNNVFIQGNANDVSVKSNNIGIEGNGDILFGKGVDATTMLTDTYELTEEAKSTYLGTDGTQVGIYGGDSPFSDIPTNPRITKKEIASKSTADGKLKVNLTVEAQ